MKILSKYCWIYLFFASHLAVAAAGAGSGAALLEDRTLVSEGAYGKVYESIENPGEVAKICTFDPDNPSCHANIKEIALLKYINHEHIVKALRAAIIKGKDGQEKLAMFLPKLDPVPKDIDPIKFLREVSLALEHMHDQNIAHKDLKEPNIMYDSKRGKVVVIDLGSGDLCTYAPKRDNGTTRWYRPLEQLLGERTKSKQLDMWALGMTVFHQAFNRSHFCAESRDGQIYELLRLRGKPHGGYYEDLLGRKKQLKVLLEGEKEKKDILISSINPVSDTSSWMPEGVSHDLKSPLEALLNVYPDERDTARQLLRRVGRGDGSLREDKTDIDDLDWRKNVLEKQTSLTEKDRTKNIEIIKELSNFEGFNLFVVMDIITIFDRFLFEAKKEITFDESLWYLLASAHLGCILHDIDIPVDEWVQLAGKWSITKDQFNAKVKEILEGLEFNLIFDHALRQFQHQYLRFDNDKRALVETTLFKALFEEPIVSDVDILQRFSLISD